VYQTEYFDRLWVLQEIAFANEVEFLCGNHRIPWIQVKALFGIGVAQIAGMRPPPSPEVLTINRSIFEARDFLSNEYFGQEIGSALNLTDQSFGPMSASGIFSPEHQESFLTDMVQMHKSMRFRTLLDFSARQKCSDPKDRILAMLDLFDAKLGKTSYPWTGEESTEQVYIEAFYYLISGDFSLQMLSMAPVDVRKNLSLPSWCPDFDCTRDKNMMLTDKFANMDLMDNIWVASRRKQRISRGPDMTKLSVRGYQVGSVLTFVEESWKAVNFPDLV
jgi:hypothetical protein